MDFTPEAILPTMGFPQLKPGRAISLLTDRILTAATPLDAQKIFSSVKGGVRQNRLKRRLFAATCNELKVEQKNANISFLNPVQDSPRPSFKLPDTDKFIKPRLAKWQLIAENLAKMDSVILKEYRERRQEAKSKSKNSNPF